MGISQRSLELLALLFPGCRAADKRASWQLESEQQLPAGSCLRAPLSGLPTPSSGAGQLRPISVGRVELPLMGIVRIFVNIASVHL